MAAVTSRTLVNHLNVTKDPVVYKFKNSIKDWWNKSDLQQYELQVLSKLPFFPQPDATRVSHTRDVNIGNNNHIHEFHIKNTLPGSTQHIVLLHGYGGALGHFSCNFDSMSRKAGVEIHALDLLGYGLSSRPDFPTRKNNFGRKLKDVTIDDVTKSEDFFVDSIEAWRRERGIEKFTLLGHSMGGYLSGVYALRYPERVEKLMLISPVGVERSKYELNSLSDKNLDIEETMQKDVADFTDMNDSAESMFKTNSEGYITSYHEMPRLFNYIWNNHHTPFDLMRYAGPIGPFMASKWTYKRFAQFHEDIVTAIHNYTYSSLAGKASGEYSLTRLLAPGALAYLPLLNRMPGNIKCPTMWLYGDVDWMSKDSGNIIASEINAAGSAPAEVRVISKAGHHLYLDNCVEFTQCLKQFMNW